MDVLAARFLLTTGHLVATCLAVQELPLTDVKVRALCALHLALDPPRCD